MKLGPLVRPLSPPSPPFVTQTEDVLKTDIKTKGTGHPPDPRPAYSSWGWKHLSILPPALSLFVV